VLPTEVTRREDPLPTMMDEGSVGRSDRTEVKLRTLEVVWLEAPESVTQLETTGGTIVVVWKEWASDCWFQELIHGGHDVGGGGARVSAKVGSTWCGGRLYERALEAIHGVHITGGRCGKGGAMVRPAYYEGGPYGRAPASITDGRGC
jgi:hypothetical protein